MPNSDDRPVGQRFDHVYVERGAPLEDSERMRRRVIATANALEVPNISAGRIIERELGIRVRYGYSSYQLPEFFEGAGVADFLSSLTLMYRVIQTSLKQEEWIKEIERIFREENTVYTIDKKGGVHYYHDEEFEWNRRSAIASLNGERYAAAREAFSGARKALNEGDGKLAIRSTFEAVEIVFQLMFDGAERLSAHVIDNRFTEALLELYPEERDNAPLLRLKDSFKEWVGGAHYFRHGQPDEDVREPALTTTILMVSAGASYLRWLAELDEQRSRAAGQ